MNDFKGYDLHKAPNELAKEILQMANKDQQIRQPDAESYKNVDIENTKRMKEIVKENGWLTIEKVGETASTAAWLLVQHADLDVDFQEYCLDLMKNLPEGQVLKKNIAYLEDRVRVNRGKPILYGTQFNTRDDGKIVLREIEDPDNVEERRKSMGMETLDEYKEFFYRKCTKEERPDDF